MTARLTWLLTQQRMSFAAVAWLAVLFCSGCTDPAPGPAILTADMPLHLEEHLAAATIEGAEIPQAIPDPIAWIFQGEEPDWQGLDHFNPDLPPPVTEHIEDALRVTLTDAHRDPRNRERLHGDIFVELPDLKRSDWSHVLVRARATEKIRRMGIGFNLRAESEAGDDESSYLFWGDSLPLVNDGTIQTYRFRADWSQPRLGPFQDPWKQLGFFINAAAPASLEIVSVHLIPKAALYQDQSVGVRTETRSYALRRTLFAHAPARLVYQVQLPKAARLDLGLGVLRDDIPVTFRVSASFPDGSTKILFEEIYDDHEHWAQRSIDLAALAGSRVTAADMSLPPLRKRSGCGFWRISATK